MSTQVIESASQSDRRTDRFSPDEVAQFERDGYVIARGMVGEALRQAMLGVTLEGLQHKIEPAEYEADLNYPGAPESRDAEGGRTIRRLKQAHGRGIAFTQWIADPGLHNRVRQLLGPEVVMPLAHHNCIMTKHPRFSSDTGWHQDIRYWSYQRPELVSVWLALGPEHPQNGCLKVLPGTHRLPIDRHRLDENLFLRPDLPENGPLIDTSILAILEPGDVLFFHARTFHAASRNYTDASKYSVVFTFRPADNPPIPGSRSASLPEILLPPAVD